MSSSARRSSTVALPLRSEVVAGPELAALLTDEVEDLAVRCGVTATARAAWLGATVAAAPERNPWAIVVRDRDGALRACMVLLDDSGPSDVQVSLAGCAMGFRSAILAHDAASAALLGHAFGERLHGRARPVRVELGPVDRDALWLTDFAATVTGAEIVPVAPIPNLSLVAVDDQGYLSSSMQRTLRKAANRARVDHKCVRTTTTRDAEEIRVVLPEVEHLRRERDHDQGRTSELDNADCRRIWGSRLERLAGERLLELSTLHIDGTLAAYVLAICEPPDYQVLEGVLATRWARYAPGRVLEAAVVERVLASPDFFRLDWMTSVAPDHLLAANGARPVCVVRVDLPGPLDPGSTSMTRPDEAV